jgi:hypothetical protein
MIAHQMKNRLVLCKIPAAQDRIGVAPWFLLHKKTKPICMRSSRHPVRCLVPRTDHNPHRLDPRRQNLFNDHLKSTLLDSVSIDQPLQREGVLPRPCRCDERFVNRWHE